MFLFSLLPFVLASDPPCPCFRRDIPAHNEPEEVRSPLPFTYTPLSSLPSAFDWREVNGTNFCTKDLNQHIPKYCGSCWLHGAMAVMNDRLKIARKGKWPEINLARQVVLNCGKDLAGSCGGGSDFGAYNFVHQFGLPDDSCQLYKASDEGGCTLEGQCMNCNPAEFGGDCYPVQRYKRWFVDEFGRYARPSIHQMKAEIFRRGPISCGIDAMGLVFDKFTPGVLVSNHSIPEFELDHVISVVGWGEEPSSGQQYWIVRNSWGTYWGEDGWFRVEMGTNALGIEQECHWATMKEEPVVKDWGPADWFKVFPSAPKPEKDPEEEVQETLLA